MTQIKIHVFIYFLFAFLVLHHSDARLLATDHQAERKVIHKVIHEGSFLDPKDNIDLSSDIMGSEECEAEDEECMKRRMVAEAHLDYIYTQHHKP